MSSKGNTLRKTKIICTLGPASDSFETIERLIKAGVDVFRLNFSHGTKQEHVDRIKAIRDIAKKESRSVGILQDLGGPKIRLGKLIDEHLELNTGTKVFLAYEKEARDYSVLPVDYPYLIEDVQEGDRILLADGTIELIVDKKLENTIVARVVVGGIVRSHKGVNLPSSSLRISAFTDKDREDLEIGLLEEVDFVSLSFIRHEMDLLPLKEIVAQVKNPPMIIGKIEKPQAVERLDKILDAVDGIMVARGDLGVETALEEVPLIQKFIISKSRLKAKPVIIATQMLMSMVSNPRPSRAETTDVANAILDGADALMLSDETAVGMHPVESVVMLDRIAKTTEKMLKEFLRQDLPPVEERSTEDAISRSAYNIARELNASVIVASTASGKTARLVSRFRPEVPVVAITHNVSTFRQLNLSWGIIPALTEPFYDTDAMFKTSKAWIMDRNLAVKGDKIVLTAGIPVGQTGTTNLIKIMEI